MHKDVVYTYTQWNVTHKKECIFAICSSMDRLGGNYVKSSESDRERQILYDTTNVRNLKKYDKLVNTTGKKQTHRYRE